MNSKHLAAVIIFILCAAGAAFFVFRPLTEKKSPAQYRTRVIVPRTPDSDDPDSMLAEDAVYDDSFSIKSPLSEGEFVVSVLNFDFDNDSVEEQIIAYRSLAAAENTVSIACFGYDEREKSYRRLWNAPVAAAMPGTISMYTMDLIGDRSPCVIITGMNAQGEHTMTVFRKDPVKDREQPFTAIAEIHIGGSINVLEQERPLAYQQGIARGRPFVITASGRDGASENMLDRVEITYTFNAARGLYEQNAITRVPGSQIEERRLREILTGEAKVFEDFIFDLWYHVSPQGTIDKSQYLYFDPANREIIFFGDETQQVFNWQHSNSTRYGIYITSQNISVTTLRRFIDIEMESLDSIRMRVYEDVKVKIGLSEPWDGLYRRAGPARRSAAEEQAVRPYTDAAYDSSMGRLRFYPGGEYEHSSGGTVIKGRYAFFRIGSQELLELRPAQSTASGDNHGDNRQVYKLSRGEEASGANLTLARVRLGSAGVHELHEAAIILTRAE